MSMNVFLLLIIFVSFLRNLVQFYNYKLFWMAIGMFIIWFTYCGTIFNINKGPPLIIVHPETKAFGIIYPRQRMQTIAEGFIVGTLLLALSGCVVGFTDYALNQKTKEEVDQAFWTVATAFGFLFLVLFIIWLLKTPGYLRY